MPYELSPFAGLYEVVHDCLTGLHGVGSALYSPDVREVDAAWYPLAIAKVERNSSSADLRSRGLTAQVERQRTDFLIERRQFPVDGQGQPRLPTEHATIRFNDHQFFACQPDGQTVWLAEDHEGTIIRFHTTDQGAY